jgi:DNA-binding MarR family transcriptional regulator
VNEKRRAAPLNLATLLHTAYSAEAEVESKLSEIGLSMAKLVALRTLSEAGEALPLSQLAQRLSCVKSNITQLVDRLEGDGFVVRQADAHDRRTKLAVLTAAGEKACREGMAIQERAEREVLKKLTSGEAQQLAALLEKVGKAGG